MNIETRAGKSGSTAFLIDDKVLESEHGDRGKREGKDQILECSACLGTWYQQWVVTTQVLKEKRYGEILHSRKKKKKIPTGAV